MALEDSAAFTGSLALPPSQPWKAWALSPGAQGAAGIPAVCHLLEERPRSAMGLELEVEAEWEPGLNWRLSSVQSSSSFRA